MEFLHSKTELRQRPDYQAIGVRFIPYILIVDKFGSIRFAGTPNEIDLEKKIQDLVD